jgi:glutamate synthase domain-containing protein 2
VTQYSRYIPYGATILLSVAFAIMGSVNALYLWPLLATVPLALIGTWDLLQSRHSVLRNYPVSAHLRFIFEGLRPELRQYFFESNLSGTPFSRDQRSLVYQRAKNTVDKKPFGTELDVYAQGYGWLNHSAAPAAVSHQPFRIEIGGADCSRPYSGSVFNISAMSFGALSANAIRALNHGAKRGGFAHDTGEGGISRYHREFGGDLIWELGSGYFGCRHNDGSFSAERFAEQAADAQIRMIEIKLSQGAKPGHGGVLPGSKVTGEIAASRGVTVGEDCLSPAKHSAFSSPIELLRFITTLRELCDGKPVGFKLCIGHHWEFMAIVKAMLETGILPDFIVIDGAEGGTGAAPVEFSNHVGTPLRTGLQFAHNTLVGAGLRDQLKLAASGKIVSAFDMVTVMALGADWCNSARGFMFAVGCIQSQACHTNCCPVGVATQDTRRQRALVVEDKAQRVYHFHRNTVEALAEVIAAASLDHPSALRPRHFYARPDGTAALPGTELGTWLERGELLDGARDPLYATNWALADPHRFAPAA